ncbi:SET domain-containing histone-lysine N-methyltransferase [Hyalangium gracile]|uniref:SET domain-containing histone-lysine N-methyltransferase n=1 Tax=Hyalangium gracile TaxID=394092 RepID=UPI001CC983C8|nr:SET domain-containing histone-lysine N-methyltransferase [Hyalangium gracile]
MSTAPETDAAIAHLIGWLEQGGAQVSPKMQVVSTGGGERGVFAREDIAPGELLLRLPRQRLVTVPDARATELGRLIEAKTGFQDPNLYLSVFLLQERERGDASPWKPFVDVQPPSFPTHPFSFQERDFALLKGSFVVELIKLQRKGLEEDHAYLSQQIPGFARFSFDDYLWAHLAVLTRVFGARLNGNQVICLAPFLDMMNDGIPWNCTWGWSPDGESLELKSGSAIAQGKELRITYGANSNLYLLRNYGFVHELNPNNVVMVPIEFSKEDPLMDEKRKLLGIKDLSFQHCFSLPLKPDAQRIIELFSELRILHAQAEEMALLQAAPDPLARAREPLSQRNELQVLRALGTSCAQRLALYETSVEEDTRLLRQENLSWTARNCILLRQGEKQILQVFAQAGG